MSVPVISLNADKLATFDAPVNIVGSILDEQNDMVSYRIIINGIEVIGWTDYKVTPLEVNIQIPVSAFEAGENTLVFECKDEFEESDSWEVIIIRKIVDSFYASASQCFNYSTSLKAGGNYIAYIKTDSINTELGYIKSGTVKLNLINGNGNSGTIRIAPVITDWHSKTVTVNTLPNIDVEKAISVNITNNDGLVSIDVTDLLKSVYTIQTYGIAIFSSNLNIELDLFGNDIEINYQPTELMRPHNVFGNKVLIQWKPLILEKPEAFIKMVLKRSTNPNFTGATTVAEITDKSIVSYLDSTISLGKYYYMLEVHYADIAFQGNQLDFDFEDRNLFTEQNPIDGTTFENGVVKLFYIPATTVNLDCESDEGAVYNPLTIEFKDGVVQLRGTEVM